MLRLQQRFLILRLCSPFLLLVPLLGRFFSKNPGISMQVIESYCKSWKWPMKWPIYIGKGNNFLKEGFQWQLLHQCIQIFYMLAPQLTKQVQLAKPKKPKLSLNIKHSNLDRYPGSNQILLKPPQENEKPNSQTERKRRASINLKDFDYMSIFKDQTVEEGFEDFFDLGERIGEGAQSIVYKCVEKSTGQTYAAKICKKRDLELFESMRVNYQILIELDHKSIVKGKYLFMDEKKLTCHLVVQYFEYTELGAYLKQNQSLEEEEASQIIASLLDCLLYLEEKGVCHRDIKPENILYDPSTKAIKLIDFELARMIRYSHQKLQLWSKCGTLSYRAPESFKGSYGTPVDMWGLGIVAFELLTGEHPFRTGYSKNTIQKICQEEIPFQNYFLSPCAIKFLEKTLSKSPKTRFTPSQALSSTFIVKYSTKKSGASNLFCSTRVEKHSSNLYGKKQLSFIDTIDDEPEFCWEKSYDEDRKFVFMNSLDKDIGVRRV